MKAIRLNLASTGLPSDAYGYVLSVLVVDPHGRFVQVGGYDKLIYRRNSYTVNWPSSWLSYDSFYLNSTRDVSSAGLSSRDVAIDDNEPLLESSRETIESVARHLKGTLRDYSVDSIAATTRAPTIRPTRRPSSPPSSAAPSVEPTLPATATPTEVPTSVPTAEPTSDVPTEVPSFTPSEEPSPLPTADPSSEPTALPSFVPTRLPSAVPTAQPTSVPTAVPTQVPTEVPTAVPSVDPTEQPTAQPTEEPVWQIAVAIAYDRHYIKNVTYSGFVSLIFDDAVTNGPTEAPTLVPSMTPTRDTPDPTLSPTARPTVQGETNAPTLFPSSVPSVRPTLSPTASPTKTKKGTFVSFNLTVALNGVAYGSFSTDAAAQMATLMTSRDGLDPLMDLADIKLINMKVLSSPSFERRTQDAGVECSFTVTTNIDTLGLSSPSEAYETFLQNLCDYVQTSQYTESLRNHAAEVRCSTLDAVDVYTRPTFSNYTAWTVGDPYESRAPHLSTSMYIIVAAVLVGILGLIIVAFVSAYVLKHNDRESMFFRGDVSMMVMKPNASRSHGQPPEVHGDVVSGMELNPMQEDRDTF